MRPTSSSAASSRPSNRRATGGGSFGVEYGLTRDDFDRIIATFPRSRRPTPLREIRKEVRYLDRTRRRPPGRLHARLRGDEPTRSMRRGRFLTDRDLDRVDNVCVIADGDRASSCFPYEDPIGKSRAGRRQVLRHHRRNRAAQAIGIIGGSFAGQDYNYDVYIPLATLACAHRRPGDHRRAPEAWKAEIVQLSQVTVTVGDIDEVEETADVMSRPCWKNITRCADYSIIVPKELLRQAEIMRIMFNVLLVLIAGIALLVGGIGIMNIMLATVTERTREIGIRRAIGAEHRDIIFQFLAETIVLTGTGGLLGIAFGFACLPGVSLVRVALRPFPRRLEVAADHDPKPRSADRPLVDHRGGRHFDPGRRHLRPLPRPAGGRDGPDRSPAARISPRTASVGLRSRAFRSNQLDQTVEKRRLVRMDAAFGLVQRQKCRLIDLPRVAPRLGIGGRSPAKQCTRLRLLR